MPATRWFGRLHAAFQGSAAGRGLRRGNEMELMHRSMGFAALGLLTLVPLLIVVAAADPGNGQGFAAWLTDGLGVEKSSQDEVERLFAPPNKALETTTGFGIAAVAIFGLPFGGVVQTGYEKIWEVPAARWHTMWRHLVWLAALIGYLLLSAHIATRPVSTGDLAWRAAAAAITAVLFFWGSQWLLLGGRLPWSALLPGAVATVIGLAGLRGFSRLVFSPLIASNAVSYGAVGTFLVVQSWLVGVGFVVFGGALVGRLLYEERWHLARGAARLRRAASRRLRRR
ncbi:YihY/virulence factor BrkB family protein [Streptomyces sp. LP05-1]|uniref:YihY/virulence factor BrkB family protein n=1 Tax=Streptomyces pyxinae TaxID=2970734 RepID=A0ABT2CKG3_9ACTN|nr:YhjD/YihY/BrkB family envelope integrity protein [Streptomyces sp. LP05-1]MCS0637186.1 YihY/virulence factor BrkB family protein [Streptomyces sp. LP05-1]